MSAKCCLCTDEFQGIDDLEAHISADHYNCLPFECEKCKFAKFPTEFAIKRHYEEDHGLVEYFIRYRVSREIFEKKQKIRECLERCLRHCDASSSQHQIGVVSRNIAGDYVNTSSHSHSHYQSSRQQLHENEFLGPSAAKVRASSNHSELFQQQHGPLLAVPTTEIRHQHQPDFGIGTGGADNGDTYEAIGGSNLIGNLLEQIKPDVVVDGGGNALAHYDLYSNEVTTASEGPRGIEKFITTQASGQDQQLVFPSKKHSIGTSEGVTTNSAVIITTAGRSISPAVKQPNQNGNSSATSSTFSAVALGGRTSYGRRAAELQCKECERMVVNRSTSLMYHVNVKHLKLPMYTCRSCGEEFLWNKSAAMKHAHRHGGDESLIDNHSERLFPTLNRHRREYFNLPKRGIESSPTPPLYQQQQEDGMANGQEEVSVKRARMRETPTDEMMEVKNEVSNNEDEELVVDEVDETADKKGQTPNTLLAQLVDMTRGSRNVLIVEDRPHTVKASPTTAGSSSHQQSTSSASTPAELKAHKSIQCGGCGDMVINQEWIMLNHVNTKHLHFPLYKCVSCNKPFENYLRSYAVRHAKFYHAGDESLLLDQRETFFGDLREACAQLFGSTNKVKEEAD